MTTQNDVAATPLQPVVLPPFTPYYADEAVTIYNADCRQVLPFLPKFDLLLTDPPYGIGEDGGMKARYREGDGRTKGIVKHKRHGWDKERPSPDAFQAMLARSDVWMIWGGNYFADWLPPSMGWLYWDKKMGGDFSDGELAYTNRQAALRSFTVHPFANLAGGKNRVHPTQKPLALMRWCLSLVEDAGTVLDPFAGSGTTGVACKLEGRKAVLIEAVEEYCEKASDRLRQGVLF